MTPGCCLRGLRGWCIKEKKKDFNKVYYVVGSNSAVDEVYACGWVRAAEIRHKKRKDVRDSGFMDSIILAKQEKCGCKIISGDRHLRGLKDVTYIERQTTHRQHQPQPPAQKPSITSEG